MVCPACHENNPKSNRFCGQCGVALRPGVREASWLDFHHQTTGEPNPEQAAAAAGASYLENGQRPVRPEEQTKQGPFASGEFSPRRVPLQLSDEVVEYDKQVPLIAEPGSDRRRQTPESILQAIREAERNAASQARANSEPANGSSRSALDSAGEPSRQVPAASAVVPVSGLNSFSPDDCDDAAAGQPPHEAAGDSAEPGKARTGYLDFTEPQRQGSVSGPSFLGLSDDRVAEFSDDEPQETNMRVRWYVALAIAVVLVILVMKQFPAIANADLQYARAGINLLKQRYQIHQGHDSVPPTVAAQPAASPPPAGTQTSSVPADAASSQLAPAGGANAGLTSAPRPESAAATANQSADQPGKAIASQSADQPSKAIASQSADQPSKTIASQSADQPSKTIASQSADQPGKALDQPGQVPDQARQLASKRASKQANELPQHDVEPPKSASKPAPPLEKAKSVPGRAQYELAMASSDPSLAAALLWRAMAQGNPDAPVRLADIYIAGQGVPRNCDQAMVLLHAAAQKGSARALGKLGVLYATGNCVPLNRVEAYRWMSLALQSTPDSEWILQNRQRIWQQMTPGERARANAVVR